MTFLRIFFALVFKGRWIQWITSVDIIRHVFKIFMEALMFVRLFSSCFSCIYFYLYYHHFLLSAFSSVTLDRNNFEEDR